MECREGRELLSAFADDELDPVRSREVELHVATCARCTAELANRRRLGAALRQDAEYHRAPDVLRARITRNVRASVRIAERPSPARAWWQSLPAAAALVAVIGGLWTAAVLVPAASTRDALTREAVDGHVRSLMASHLTDVTSTDRHTVKPWFAGRIDFSPPVVDFVAQDYPLVGGRLDVIGGRPVAALVYHHRQHVINAFVWPDVHEEATRSRTLRGYHVVTVRHAGMAWCLVSDLNLGELTALARLLTRDAAG